jgi:hypothetical protein
MKLSPDEETFLHQWIYDEVHFADGAGPAKQLQLQHRAIPADLAVLIAAGIPDPAEQAVASQTPLVDHAPRWPWHDKTLQSRVSEARRLLEPSMAAKH